MLYRRYGKFRFRDYTSAWFIIAFLFVLVVFGFLTNTPFYLLIWPLLLLMVMAWSIYKATSECFFISGNTITIIQGRKKQKVTIPSEPTLIVSYADVCPPLAKRISCGNQTYMLKGRYAISILQQIPLETAFERLHQNYARKYTNSTVEEDFEEYFYVYGFVGTQDILNKLISDRNCQIIIPETLTHQISIDLYQTNVHIDAGYQKTGDGSGNIGDGTVC